MQIRFLFVMRKTSCCLFLTIIKQMLFTSSYLDDLLNIDNPYFKQTVSQIYPTELQFDKASSSDTEALFLDLNFSINKCHSFS